MSIRIKGAVMSQEERQAKNAEQKARKYKRELTEQKDEIESYKENLIMKLEEDKYPYEEYMPSDMAAYNVALSNAIQLIKET